MKIFIRVNRPAPTTKCVEHAAEWAAYELELEVFGRRFKRPSCAQCLCRHFNLQTFFSVEDGLALPPGLRHRAAPVGSRETKR